MKFTIAIVLALQLTVAPAFAQTYKCAVGGEIHLVRVDEAKNILEWRGVKYSISDANKDDLVCAAGGWHAVGNGTSFNFCRATHGYGNIQDGHGIANADCVP